MNIIMMMSLDMDVKTIFTDGFSDITILKQIRVMIEERKFSPTLEKEIKATMK